MARIPDGYNARPIPNARSPIVAVRNAGAFGEAMSGLGDQINKMGTQALEKQDKLAYALAKASYLSETEAAKREFQDDPDHATFGTRFAARMEQARDKAMGGIQSRSDRAMFEGETKVLFEENNSAVLKLARGKYVSERKGQMLVEEDNLLDQIGNATDVGAQLQGITTYEQMQDGAFEEGIIDAEEAVKNKLGFQGKVATGLFVAAEARGDVDGMASVLSTQGHLMPLPQRMAAMGKVADGMEFRDIRSTVLPLIGSTESVTGAPVNIGDPLRGKGGMPTMASQKFGAGRDGGSRLHNGMDMPAATGTPVYSMAGTGTVSSTTPASAGHKGGNIVVVRHSDGSTTKYMHLSAINVKRGDQIGPDTKLGAVGNTGTSSGPHLHVEYHDKGGKPVDPAKMIGQTVQASSADMDRGDVYEAIDAKVASGEKTPEWGEKAKRFADQEIARDRKVSRERAQEIREQGLAVSQSLGYNFTDPATQVPNWHMLKPTERQPFLNMAKANQRALDMEAKNGEYTGELERYHSLYYASRMGKVVIDGKEVRFTDIDLREHAPYLTKGQYNELSKRQIDMQTDTSGAIGWRGAIASTITAYASPDMKLKGQNRNQARYDAVSLTMESLLSDATDGWKRKPTDEETRKAFFEATKQVAGAPTERYIAFGGASPTPTKVTFGRRENTKPVYDLTIDDVPTAARKKIVEAYRKTNGTKKDPPDDIILGKYRAQLARTQ